MKKTFTILIAALAAILMMALPGKAVGQTSYQAVLTFDCATASSNGSSTTYGVSNSTAMNASQIDAFLEAAASTSNKISVSDVSGSIYWAKGSGGTGIPDDCLKVGKASGAGAFTFVIDDSYDAIDRIVITGYGWKTTSTIAVNNQGGQSPTTAATETTFTFDFNSSTRSFAISVTSSAVCVTEIKLYKKVTVTPSIAFTGTTTHNAPYTGTANHTFTGTYSNLGNNPTFNVAFYATAAANTDPLTGDDIPNWLSVSAYNNSGALGGQFTVNANNGNERHAYFKVYSGTTYSSNVYTVNQAAAPYTVTLNKYAVNVDYTQHDNLQDIDVTTNLSVSGVGDFVVYFYANATDEDDNPLENAPSWIPSATVVYNATAEKYQVKYTINSCPSNVSSSRVAYFRVYAADDNNEAYSETVTVTQTPMPQAATPQFEPGAGAVTIGTTVELSCETANSTIYYTINGGDITEYEDAITINTATTIQAFASADGYRDSETATAEYTIAKVTAPTFTPNGGVFTSTQEVTINKADGATVYYTLDGTAPSTSSTLYKGAFTLSTTTTVKAIAVKANYANSDVAEATFTKAEVHTVAWAIANTPSSGTSENYYIQGVVSSLYSTSIIADDYHRYYIKDENANNELLVFNGKGLNNVAFSNANDLLVGDEVLIYGGLTTYNSTKEIAKDNYIVTLVRRPSIDAENVNLAANATSGEITYTLNNPVEGGELSISKTGDWFTANLVTAENKVTLSTTANTGEERTGTVTITYTYNTNETVSKEVAVKQASGIQSSWILTDFDDLTSADVFVIVGTPDNGNNYYSVSNNANPPAASSIEITYDQGVYKLSSEPATTIQWNISGNATDGYTFYPVGNPESWLNCKTTTSSKNNDCIAIGNSESNVTRNIFDLDGNGYLITKDDYTTRYISYYSTNDEWRGYVNTSNNPAVMTFYKKVTDPVTRTLYVTGCGESAGGYHLIASPVASVTPTSDNGFLCTADGNNYDLYSFDQAQNGLEWRNYRVNTFNIESGKGYLYASKNGTTLSFTGQPYNGNGVVALNYTAEKPLSGWNLIGNPFNATAYLADNRAFYRMNNDGDGIFVATNNAINSKEGIFVQAANANDKSVVFTTTVPGAKLANSRLVLNIVGKSDNVIDRAIVRFDNGGTLEKLTLREYNTKIYIPQHNVDYAVVCCNGYGNMPVNFKAAEMGKYTISVNTEGIDMDYLHLIDRLTGEDVNLLLDNSYSFVASAQDVESRFILSFTATGYNADADEPFAYQNGSEIIVSGEGELQIFDVTGRQIMTTTINGIESVNVSAKGVLILRLVGTEVKTQKMVVR